MNIDTIFEYEVCRDINVDRTYFNDNVSVVEAIESYLADRRESS